MSSLKAIATGAAVVGSLGLAALGLGSGMANAAPSPAVSGTSWAQWGPGGPGPGGPGWNNGPGWGPPPPPAYGGYGYGAGYGAPVSACVNGPLGLLHVCL